MSTYVASLVHNAFSRLLRGNHGIGKLIFFFIKGKERMATVDYKDKTKKIGSLTRVCAARFTRIFPAGNL